MGNHCRFLFLWKKMEKIVEALPANLDLFSEPSALLSIGDTYFEAVSCKQALDPTSPPPSMLEFTANADRTHYTSLADSYLLLKCKYLVKADKTNVDLVPQVGPVNNLHSALFRSVDMWLNNKKITPPEQNQHYISHFNILTQPEEVQKTVHSLSGYFSDAEDTIGIRQPDPQSAVDPNPGLKIRANMISDSKEVILIGKLYNPPHLIKRYFPPNCKFDWRFELENYAFYTMQERQIANDKYMFVLTDAKMLVKRIKVNPSIALSHSKLIEKKNMVFPSKYMQSRQAPIPSGSYSFKFDSIFQGLNMPTAIFMVLLESEGKKGHLQKNPFVFEDYKMSEVKCNIGAKTLPSVPYKINCNKFQSQEALLDLYLALQNMDLPTAPAHPKRFSHTLATFILGFDLSRDGNPSASYENSNFDGSSVGVELFFHEATSKNLTCKFTCSTDIKEMFSIFEFILVLVIGLFNGKLELNRFLDPIATWM